MIRIRFRPWRRFTAGTDEGAIKSWLTAFAAATRKAYLKGIDGPHTGRIYRIRGRRHQASIDQSNREFPAKPTGRQRRSLRSRVTARRVETGTSVFYAKYLAGGTIKMKPRKWSKHAHQEARNSAGGRLTRSFATWRR